MYKAINDGIGKKRDGEDAIRPMAVPEFIIAKTM